MRIADLDHRAEDVVPGCLDRPAEGQVFSGSEHRADYDVGHLQRLLASEGLALAEDIGDVCGQRTLALRPAPIAA